MSASTARGIQNFKLSPLRPKDQNVEVMFSYLRSTCFLIVMFLLPYLYLTVGQELPYTGVFPEFDRREIQRICAGSNGF